MPSSITFTTKSGSTLGAVVLQDFVWGNSQGKGKGGRGYPPGMRALWIEKQRSAMAMLANDDFLDQLLAARENETVFSSAFAITAQPFSRVMMRVVTITALTRYIGEPKTAFLHFETFTTLDR
jgi:hypothetical protein